MFFYKVAMKNRMALYIDEAVSPAVVKTFKKYLK